MHSEHCILLVFSPDLTLAAGMAAEHQCQELPLLIALRDCIVHNCTVHDCTMLGGEGLN